jgi:PAS domain S-box-containing protein
MSIKNKLYLLGALVLVATGIFLLLFVTYSDRIQQELNYKKIADNIVRDTSELVIIIQEYSNYQYARTEVQWKSNLRNLQGLVDTALKSGYRPGDFNSIKVKLFKIDKLFNLIKVSFAQRKTKLSDKIPLSKINNYNIRLERLSAQLHQNAHEVLSRSFAISSSAYDRLNDIQRESNVVIIAAVILGGSLLGIAIYLIIRGIINPLKSLVTLSRRIEQGQYQGRHTQVGLFKKGELAELYEGFMSMTDKLLGTIGDLDRDIVRRKMVEEALLQSEEQFRLAFENANDGVCLIDLHGNMIKVNERMCGIFGYSKKELESMTVNEITHPEDENIGLNLIDKSLSGEFISGIFEKRYIHKQGYIIYGQASSSIIKDKGGKPLYFISHVQDITESKRSEEEKKRLESQLRQAQKMEAVGTLAGGIAHDFNNILAAIMGYAELALGDAKDGKASPEEIEQVLIGAQRAARLVKQILMFSRQAEPEFKPLDINKEAINAANLLRNTIPRMIEIALDLSEDICLIQGDVTEIQQVLLNLATNAKDAMPQGGKLTIRTKLVQVEEELCRACFSEFSGEYVLVSVGDTGEGMDEQTLEKIFDPFFTTKEVGKGTGLGLSTIFGIVTGHGGHITVDSQPGMGSTFNIYLPVPEEDLQVVTKEETDEDIAGGSETILFVDDEKSILHVGNKILHGKGYSIIAASNGEEAVKTYNKMKDDIALVILDVSMPGMGGHKCLQELQSIDPEVKVIICSGYFRGGDLKETLYLGASGFIPKPFSSSTMLKTVRKVLDA